MKTPPDLFLRTRDLEKRIAHKYPEPAWTTLFELRDGTGFQTRGQAADAMAFGTWPSRGLEIIGFEIKTSRSDWRRELKNPEKAEGLARFCDSWFLVTADGAAKLEEIPMNWGWFVGTAQGLKLMKPARPLKPKPISKIFLMSIMRSVGNGYVPKSRVKDLAEKQAEDIAKSKRDDNKYRLEDLEKLSKRVAVFKEATGIDLFDEYGFPTRETGAVVKAVMDQNIHYQIRKVQDAADGVKKILDVLGTLPLVQAGRNGKGS